MSENAQATLNELYDTWVGDIGHCKAKLLASNYKPSRVLGMTDYEAESEIEAIFGDGYYD